MVNARFTIGDNEKHIIEVSDSMWTGKLNIWVDGVRTTSTLFISASWHSWRFQVGNQERHDIELRVGGVIIPKFELIVDGRIVGTA